MKRLIYLWQRRRARLRVERLFQCSREAHAEGFLSSGEFYLKLARDAEMEFHREYPDAPAGCIRREAPRRPWYRTWPAEPVFRLTEKDHDTDP